MPTKLVARNKKRITYYIYCRKAKYGNAYFVSTKTGWPQLWSVDGNNIEILRPDLILNPSNS